MSNIIRITDLCAANLPPCDSRLPEPEPELWRSHRPELHCMLLDCERVVAHCSLWWKSVPEMPGERLGVIGHYAAVDQQAGVALLAEAATELRSIGCSLAVGPMDGNTWRRYRFVTERGTEPPFFLEPDNRDDWPLHFCDFTPLAEYTSTLNSDLTQIDERIERAKQRLANNGVVIRGFRVSEFEAELRRIFEVSAISFRENFLYTPLPEDQFVGQYLRIRERVRPELVMLAEHEGRPVGYVFGIPDWLQKARGQDVDTVIIKTLAVMPGRTCAGLGSVLVHECQQRARSLGCARAIHALMHSSNSSRNIGGASTRTMRRYTLFARRL